jgi:hypothetical protein
VVLPAGVMRQGEQLGRQKLHLPAVLQAEMVELVYAAGSEPADRKVMRVRPPLSALPRRHGGMADVAGSNPAGGNTVKVQVLVPASDR